MRNLVLVFRVENSLRLKSEERRLFGSLLAAFPRAVILAAGHKVRIIEKSDDLLDSKKKKVLPRVASNWRTDEEQISYQILSFVKSLGAVSLIFIHCPHFAFHSVRSITTQELNDFEIGLIHFGIPNKSRENDGKRVTTARWKHHGYIQFMTEFVNYKVEVKEFVSDSITTTEKDNHEMISAIQKVLQQLGEQKQEYGDVPDYLVSIIVTHYNLGSYIDCAISDLLNQNYPRLEVIFVDDASDDENARLSYARAKEKYSGDSRILFIDSEINRYVGAARNLGASASKGELLVFFDVDNRACPNMISSLVRAIHRSGCAVVSASSYVGKFSNLEDHVELKGGVKYVRVPLGGPRECGIFENVFGDAVMAIWKEHFFAIGGFFDCERVPFEDWDLFLRILDKGLNISVLNEPTYFYNVRADSMLQSGNIVRGRRHIRERAYRRQLIETNNNLTTSNAKIPRNVYWFDLNSVLLNVVYSLFPAGTVRRLLLTNLKRRFKI